MILQHRQSTSRIPLRAAVALVAVLAVATGSGASDGRAAGEFVNFETPHVHPLDLSPDGSLLAAVNTAAHRLELFDVADGTPRRVGSVPVGLDPVSVRFRSNGEAWVVNQISDSISVVDVATRRVRATLDTLDEPADVVFAGAAGRAFVSCSQADAIQVFDPEALERPPRRIAIEGEDPRALAVSGDGATVYAAIFESGNRSTVLAGGFQRLAIDFTPTLPANVVSDPAGPHGGANPPPNSDGAFEPPIDAALPPPPPVSLIVKQDAAGRWLDDTGADWTAYVSGSRAAASRRRPGWRVLDNDLAVIDADRLRVRRYVGGLMNLPMALAVRPGDGAIAVVGTDALNEVRFEPNLNGRFLRVLVAVAPAAGGAAEIRDLNPHLDYRSPRLPRRERDRSLGDPRAIVFTAGGERGWVAGLGSNNVVEIDAAGRRAAGAAPIEVGQGPTGLALDEGVGRLYVLDRFGASISVVDLDAGRRIERVRFPDPTPRAIRRGRPLLYDTHRTSGLGHVSCASCHVDARTDRLAWDLGAPDAGMIPVDGRNTTLFDGDVFRDWHPMKGPMTTQTLQDIVGKEPHHWRGDRRGLEEFAAAFRDLLGDDAPLGRAAMRRFERFLGTIHFPPNPFRELDNGLPTRLRLRGHYRTGRFGRAGRPLPAGNPRRGLELFRTRGIDGDRPCVGCHTLPTGQGTPAERRGDAFVPLPRGPQGEASQALIGLDFSEQLGFKIPHLRNAYDKVGMETTRKVSRAGFGFFHDGAIDSLARFVSAEVFDLRNDQEVADLVALMLAFSGSGFDARPGEPPGSPSLDAHAAVGRQATVAAADERRELLGTLVDLAASGAVDLVVKGVRGGAEAGWLFDPAAGGFRPAGGGPAADLAALVATAAPGAELTFTAVPAGSGDRISATSVESRRRGSRRGRLDPGERRPGPLGAGPARRLRGGDAAPVGPP